MIPSAEAIENLSFMFGDVEKTEPTTASDDMFVGSVKIERAQAICEEEPTRSNHVAGNSILKIESTGTATLKVSCQVQVAKRRTSVVEDERLNGKMTPILAAGAEASLTLPVCCKRSGLLSSSSAT